MAFKDFLDVRDIALRGDIPAQFFVDASISAYNLTYPLIFQVIENIGANAVFWLISSMNLSISGLSRGSGMLGIRS